MKFSTSQQNVIDNLTSKAWTLLCRGHEDRTNRDGFFEAVDLETNTTEVIFFTSNPDSAKVFGYVTKGHPPRTDPSGVEFAELVLTKFGKETDDWDRHYGSRG